MLVVSADLQSAVRHPQNFAACGHKHPSQAKRACSWMIWPSGGGVLPRCRLHCLAAAVVVDNMLQLICNLLPVQPRRGRSSPYGSRNHRAALYCRQADSAAACSCSLQNFRSQFPRLAGARRALRELPAAHAHRCRSSYIPTPVPLTSVSRICNSALSAACSHKHPSQSRKACSWMIWPSGWRLWSNVF